MDERLGSEFAVDANLTFSIPDSELGAARVDVLLQLLEDRVTRGIEFLIQQSVIPCCRRF